MLIKFVFEIVLDCFNIVVGGFFYIFDFLCFFWSEVLDDFAKDFFSIAYRVG
jgi:hypothetical protein